MSQALDRRFSADTKRAGRGRRIPSEPLQLPSLRIELLGPLRVFISGQPLSPKVWDRQKTKSLLKLLLTAPGRGVSSQEIIDALWPDLDPETAATSLRASVSKLRKVLEPNLAKGRLSRYVVTDGAGYAFTPTPDCVRDTDEVAALHRNGHDAHQRGRFDDAITQYLGALNRYRGECFADEADASWAIPHRTHWAEVHRTILMAKAECHMALGQYSSAIQDYRATIERDPGHEEAWRRLMLCHYVSGRQGDAAAVFRECETALKRALGAGPSEETVRLYEQILRRRVSGIDNTPRTPVTVVRSTRVPHSLGRLRFVGRDREVGLLASHLDAALQGQGGLVAVGGEPGVGKTRLAEELLLYARSRNFLTATGRCYTPAFRRPYEPLAEIIREFFKGPGRSPLLSLSAVWLACAAKIVPDLPLPKDAPLLPPVPPEQEQPRLFEALTRLLTGLAAQRPLALLIDDLHWADDETLVALHYLAGQISSERVVILTTYRTEETTSNPRCAQLLASRPLTLFRNLQLPQLPSQAIVDLFRTMRAHRASPIAMDRLARRVHAETQGNPLFVVEVLQTLLEEGVLTVNGRGKWAAAPQAVKDAAQARWRLPHGIRRLILARLQRLDQARQDCLGLLSAVSRGFSQDLMERLFQPDGVATAKVLDELLQSGFLLADPQTPGSFRFAHDNIRQTVYDALSPSRKQAAHLRVAQVLEVLDPSGARAPAELAHHFALAAVWPKAFQYTIAAGEAAYRTYAFASALSQFDQAEQILDAHGPSFLSPEEQTRRRIGILFHRQAIFCAQGHTKKREQIVLEMVRLAHTLNDPVQLADVYLALACLHGSRREWPRAIELATQSLASFERHGDQEGMARAYRELGYGFWQSERFDRAIEANQRALQIHQAMGNARGVAGDYHNLGQVYTSMGNYESGLAYYRKARWEFHRLGERADESRTLNILSRIHRLSGNLSEALSNTLEALEADRATGNRNGELFYLMDAAFLWLALGNLDQALATYETVLQVSKTLGGNAEREGHALRGMGVIYERQHRHEQAAACLTDAAALLHESGDLAAWAEVCERLGDLTLDALRQPDRVLHYYHAAAEYYRKHGPTERLYSLLNKMGYMRWKSGHAEEAIPLYRELLHLGRSKQDRGMEGAAAASLGVVYRETGRLSESRDASLRALAVAHALRDGQAEGYVLSSLCDTYLALGQRARAEAAARRALRHRPDDPWACHRLATVLRAQGKHALSRRYAAKARSLAKRSGDRDLLALLTKQVRRPHA